MDPISPHTYHNRSIQDKGITECTSGSCCAAHFRCFPFSLSFCQTHPWKHALAWFPLICTCTHQLGSQQGLRWELAKKPEMTRQRLERCFQKDTVKKLWLLYRFNKYLTPVWLTTIDPSFCGAQSNLECWGAPEPQSLILTQATATVKPAYLHLLKSAGVSVYFYVCVCTCARGDCRPS